MGSSEDQDGTRRGVPRSSTGGERHLRNPRRGIWIRPTGARGRHAHRSCYVHAARHTNTHSSTAGSDVYVNGANLQPIARRIPKPFPISPYHRNGNEISRLWDSVQTLILQKVHVRVPRPLPTIHRRPAKNRTPHPYLVVGRQGGENVYQMRQTRPMCRFAARPDFHAREIVQSGFIRGPIAQQIYRVEGGKNRRLGRAQVRIVVVLVSRHQDSDFSGFYFYYEWGQPPNDPQ